MKLDANQKKCETFDQSKVLCLSTVKPHREVAKRITVPAGKYAIVPATMNAGETGIFVVAMYHNAP